MLTAAFLLGFTGSLHCIGMCGPLAVQVQAANKNFLLFNRILYNVGRVLTYSLLGLLAGTFGHIMEVSGWQGWFSILLGVLIFSGLVFNWVEKWIIPGTLSVISALKQGISKFLQSKSAGSSLLMGILNGVLPCGLVYAAIVLSLVQTNWLHSVLVMMVFGLGTVPAMFAVAWSYGILTRLLPVPVKKIQVYFIGVMAFLLVWRGASIEGLFSIDQTMLCYPLH
ncbi:MAG: sulfite exporter TauE/SafE family protein [Cyclobacteriaceae bacterium]